MPQQPIIPELIDVPLSVEIIDSEIVVDGSLPVTVSLTRDAALETGIELLNAALRLSDETKDDPPNGARH